LWCVNRHCCSDSVDDDSRAGLLTRGMNCYPCVGHYALIVVVVVVAVVFWFTVYFRELCVVDARLHGVMNVE